MNKLKELKVHYNALDKELAGKLIADCFYKNDIIGVVIESPQEINDDWGDDAIVQDSYSVSGYIYEEELFKIDLIKEDISKIGANLNLETEYKTKDVNEEDWANSWKEFFYPVEVSENIVIKPTWRELEKDYKIVIEIDPGMAFGSGSHPTTNLCIKMLEEYVDKDKTVLDIGCGSGILMIAASKLSAGYITGIDNDLAAVDISKANLLLNNIDESKFRVLRSDLTDKIEDRYDIIVANILAEVIIQLIPDIKNVAKKGTKLIFSGIIEDKKDLVIDKMKEFNIEPEKIYDESGWVAISGIYK